MPRAIRDFVLCPSRNNKMTEPPTPGQGQSETPAPVPETPWLVSLWSRIKEHKIVQWTVAYAAFAFVALHVATLVSDALEWPHAVVRAVTLALIFGLPIAPIIAWYHGVRALRRASIAEVILIALVLVIAGSLLWHSPRPSAEADSARTVVPVSAVAVKADSPGAVFSPPLHTIAVLPFVNMSGDAKQDYFSDGISEELLNALSRLNDLQVVARTSSFSFKGQNVDVSTIAHKLNVGAVLEGSVRRAGNTVRITAQLINTVTGFHLWSETYDRPFKDILKVQTEVATAVAQQLEIKLAGNESAKFEIGGTKNPEAYDAYLRGQRLYQENIYGIANLHAALADLDHAIALDPDYAGAHVLRASIFANLTFISTDAQTTRGLREQALASAEHAVSLAPDFGDAHVVLGRIREEDFLDFFDAAAEFDRALALAPGSAFVQRIVAVYTALLGRFDTAITAAARAVRLDPQNWIVYRQQQETFLYARRYGEALAALQHAQAIHPGSPDLNQALVDLLFNLGQIEQVRRLCEAPTTPLDEDVRHAFLAMVYHVLGRQGDAQHELDQLRKLDGDSRPYFFATIYANWGDASAALQWLAKAEQIHDPLISAIKVDPLLDPIRNEPQFKALLARMNFPP
jgi:TolB-like protein/Flp pilus assembly protein TadD